MFGNLDSPHYFGHCCDCDAFERCAAVAPPSDRAPGHLRGLRHRPLAGAQGGVGRRRHPSVLLRGVPRCRCRTFISCPFVLFGSPLFPPQTQTLYSLISTCVAKGVCIDYPAFTLPLPPWGLFDVFVYPARRPSSCSLCATFPSSAAARAPRSCTPPPTSHSPRPSKRRATPQPQVRAPTLPPLGRALSGERGAYSS